MMQDKKVQFVCFETTLGKDRFIKRWEQYTRSLNSDSDVTLQQSETDGMFSYIAQHRFEGAELQFIFSKEGRTSRIPQERIKTTQAGGYSILRSNKIHRAATDDCKVFLFLTDYATDLTSYKNLSAHFKLNIYQAYYENCKYAYILEYFLKAKYVAKLKELLQELHVSDVKIYKECNFVKGTNIKTEQEAYAWPK